LAQQLNQGLLADVFASASKKYMEAAVQSGRVAQGASKTFVYNRLVVIFPVDNPGGLKELEDLAKPGLKLDFAAKEVPVGQYTLDFLDKASQDSAFPPGFKDSVLKNVVSYEDNVKAVLAKITLGEADGGIVYLSDITAGATDKVGIIDIPDALNVIATYPIAPVSDSPNAGLAQAFITLVLSPTGQGILEKYRFTPYEKMPAQPAPAPSSSAFTITKRQFRQALVFVRPEYLDAFMQLYPSSTKCYNPPVM
jgi:molybdate transport system substrate-binding protein